MGKREYITEIVEGRKEAFLRREKNMDLNFIMNASITCEINI